MEGTRNDSLYAAKASKENKRALWKRFAESGKVADYLLYASSSHNAATDSEETAQSRHEP